MKTLNLKHANGSYDILIKKGIFENIKENISNVEYDNLFIITDQNVYNLYEEKIKKMDFKKIVKVVPGEKSKSFETYKKVCTSLLSSNITRSDLIITLGGGVVGDLGGFVAATLLRGIKFLQVPTTLLSQVDSSIGGKVAINANGGKNLVGNFYQPIKVIIDPEFLLTLDSREIKSGLGELIKHSLIKDSKLFYNLLNYSNFEKLYKDIEDILYKSLKVKKDVVQKDEYDKSIRMILNFGHTIGHAIEKKLKVNEISHGEAIAIGMLEITKISEKKGLTKKNTSKKIYEILEKYNFKIKSFKLNELIKYIKMDKKILNNKLNLILLKDIGKAYIKRIKISQLEEFLGVDYEKNNKEK
ncbi:MAG: 3-dehydroquinate synthase [Bacillota bacterium]